MKNIDPHANCSSNAPPTTWPIGTPIPAVADQMAIAFARSCRGNVSIIIDSVAGVSVAAPMPVRARALIS